MVDDRKIERPLADPSLSLEGKAERLIELACKAGGLDNITVVVVQVSGGNDPSPDDGVAE